MALHRDIYWVGRQWAVTGLGMQAVDQRLKGAFDVDIARLWEDDLPQRMRALAWVNLDEFNKALQMARERFPRPPRKALPLVESVLELIPPAASDPPKRAAPPPLPKQAAAVKDVAPAPLATPIVPAAVELPPPQVEAPPLQLRIEQVTAKFVPSWRIRHQLPRAQSGGITRPG